MLKLLKINGRKKLIAALSAAALVFSGGTRFFIMDSISVYAASGEYKSWKQSDPRWSGIYLGASGETMSQSGCAVTSVACLAVHSGIVDESQINPGILCDFLNQNGGLDCWGNIYWGVVTRLVPDFIFERTAYLYGSTAQEKTAEIKSYLDQGYYVISDVRYSGHWVAVDKVEDGIVYSIDPASGTSNKMFEQYNFNGTNTLKLFRKAGSVIQTPSSSVTYKTGSYITTAKLNLRSKATSSSEKLDLIDNNYNINVTEISGNWGKVCFNNKTGWICLDYAIRTGDLQSEKQYLKGVYITDYVINYRERADVSSLSFGTVPKETSLTISEISSGWGKTEYNGKECWVCLEYTHRVSDLPSTGVTVTEPVKPEETTAAATQTPQTEAPSVTTVTSVPQTLPPVTQLPETTPVVTTVPQAVTTIQTNTVTTVASTTVQSVPQTTAAQTRIPAVTEPVYENIIPGDINGDGIVNAVDMMCMIDVFLNDKVTSYEFSRYDVNNDMVVSSKDIMALKFILLSEK